VELLLGDLFLSHKARKWQDINSLLGGSVLWIIISITGTCDGKISQVKVTETLEKKKKNKQTKTRTFELYFTSFINLQGKASKRCHSCALQLDKRRICTGLISIQCKFTFSQILARENDIA